MALSGKTARRKILFPKPSDAFKPANKDIEEIALQLDNDAETAQGTKASLPAAALRGRLYMVQGDIASRNGILWWDSGATNLPVQPFINNVPAASKIPTAATNEEWPSATLFTPPTTARSNLTTLVFAATGQPSELRTATVTVKSGASEWEVGKGGLKSNDQFYGSIVFIVPPLGEWKVVYTAGILVYASYTVL